MPSAKALVAITLRYLPGVAGEQLGSLEPQEKFQEKGITNHLG